MQLVHTPSPADLKQFVVDLFEGVENGTVTGIGAVVTIRGGRFYVDAFGSLVRDPYAARGYIRELDDCLREIGHRKKNSSTTI